MKTSKILKSSLSLIFVLLLVVSTFIIPVSAESVTDETADTNYETEANDSIQVVEPKDDDLAITSYSNDEIATTSAKVPTPFITNISSGSAGMRISWNECAGVYKYRVFVKKDGKWSTIARTDKTHYVWTKGELGKKYTFTVRCIDKDDKYTSDYDKTGVSSYCYVDTPSLNSITGDGTNIYFTWDKVENAYKYVLFYNEGTSWKVLDSTTKNKYTFSHAVICKTYVFTIRCYDKNNTPISNYVRNGYKYTSYLKTPQISSINRYDNSCIIRWSAVPNAYKYRIFYKNDTKWKKIADVSGDSYIWEGIELKKQYKFTIRCINKDKKFTSLFDSNGYDFIITKKKLATPKISKISDSGRNVVIQWGQVNGATKYRLFYKTSSDTKWTRVTTTKSIKYTWPDVPYGKKIYYTVRCIDVKENKYLSNYDKTGTAHTFYLGTPKLLSVSLSGKKALLEWGKVTGAHGYRLFYKNGTSWKKIGDTTKTSYLWSGVTLGKSITYTIRCIDKDGNYTSKYDKTGFTIKLEKGVVATPVITSVASSSKSSVLIKWNKVTGAYKYVVFAKTTSSWKKLGKTASTSYKWIYVEPNQKYYYTVRCIDANGSYISDYDKTGFEYTLKSDLLATPQITKIEMSGTKVKITWNPVNNAYGYYVFYKTDHWKNIGETRGNTFTYGAPVGDTLTYTVRCVDANGNFTSNFDSNGYAFTALNMKYVTVNVPKGKTYFASTSYTNWKSTDKTVATAKNGFILGKGVGSCKVTGFNTTSGTEYTINTIASEPVRFLYTSPNCATMNKNVKIIAITDSDRTGVRFNISGGTDTPIVDATLSNTVTNPDKTNTIKIWSAKVKFTEAGTFDVAAYATTGASGYQTCTAGKSTVFVCKSSASTSDTTTSTAARRASNDIINFISQYEGFITNIYDDPIAPGNYTIGYGKVIGVGSFFYNSITKEEAYANLVDTVNKGSFTSDVNNYLSKNGVKFNQQQFDALVSLSYNCGTGCLEDTAIKNALTTCYTTYSGDKYYYTNTNSVAVRKGPGFNYGVITTLSVNVKFKKLSKKYTDWYYVTLSDGTKGYVSSLHVIYKSTGSGKKDLNYVDKQSLVNSIAQWHHASGTCYRGLLNRRIDELDIFLFGEYDINGSNNVNKLKFYCAKYPDFHS